MAADLEAVRERARTAHYEPPAYGLDDPVWTAEDPETGCLGVGEVEAEAVGNLLAVVAQFDREDDADPKMKVPGRVIARPNRGGSGDLIDRLRSLF